MPSILLTGQFVFFCFTYSHSFLLRLSSKDIINPLKEFLINYANSTGHVVLKNVLKLHGALTN